MGILAWSPKSRMRIRVVKAAAVLRPLKGTLSPSGSRDVKRKEKERRGEGEREREGGVWADSPYANLSIHTKSNKATVRSVLRQTITFCFLFQGSNMASHTHLCSVLMSVDIIHSLGPNLKNKLCNSASITTHLFQFNATLTCNWVNCASAIPVCLFLHFVTLCWGDSHPRKVCTVL